MSEKVYCTAFFGPISCNAPSLNSHLYTKLIVRTPGRFCTFHDGQVVNFISRRAVGGAIVRRPAIGMGFKRWAN